MKEEKRKSMLTLLLAPRLAQSSLNKDNKQNSVGSDFAKFNNYSEQSSPVHKFTRIVKRIGAKQTISSFHAELSEPKTSMHMSSSPHPPPILREVKAEKQNIQGKEIRKKLKRVGKKVWVTAYKQSISQLQQVSLITNKQQFNTEDKTEKYEYRQFKQDNSINDAVHRDERQKNDQLRDDQTRNGRHTVNPPIRSKEPSRISEPYLKKNTLGMASRMQQSDSQKEEENSETNNIPIQVESELEILVENKNQFEGEPELPNVDIDRMLQEIQSDQAMNKSTHKQSSIGKRKSARNSKRSSRFANKPNDQQSNATNIIEIKPRKPRGRQSTFKMEENKIREPIMKNSQPIKPTRRQSNFQDSQQKSLKKPLPPAYPFSQENTKSILSSDHEGIIQIPTKEKVPLFKKQSSIHSAESSVGKVQLQRAHLRQFRKQLPFRQKQSESYHSMHYSQKKQGTRKIGIQRFKNLDGDESRITSSLKKNKNLEMNRYVAEARKEVVTDDLFRQTGYRI